MHKECGAGRASSIRSLLSSAEPSSARFPPPQAGLQFLFCVVPGSKQTSYLSVSPTCSPPGSCRSPSRLPGLVRHLYTTLFQHNADSFKTICCCMNQKPFHHCNVLTENKVIYSYNYPRAKGLRQPSLGLFNSLTLVHPKVIEYLSS